MGINFTQCYYVKLGKGGVWEESSIEQGKIRIGWKKQTLDDINSGNWPKIREELQKEIKNKGAATRDFNALRRITVSTPEDIWITFHRSLLWWCQVASQSAIQEDTMSKFRMVEGHWNSCDLDDNPLYIYQIPGTLSKIQAFRGTICRVRAVATLRRLLNNQPSEAHKAIKSANEKLVLAVERGVRPLHWKDFEVLVDLLFRSAGWRRVGILGETIRDIDLELEEPVTGDLYQVQIKSSATMADFREAAKKFSGSHFKKLYFFVHTPQGKWDSNKSDENVELILPKRLAEMTVQSGLTDWLVRKIK